MNHIHKQMQLIKRIDQLIRLKATGNPVALAHRLGISKAKLYRTLSLMKSMDASVGFDKPLQTYKYTQAVGFKCGFFMDPEFSQKNNT